MNKFGPDHPEWNHEITPVDDNPWGTELMLAMAKMNTSNSKLITFIYATPKKMTQTRMMQQVTARRRTQGPTVSNNKR